MLPLTGETTSTVSSHVLFAAFSLALAAAIFDSGEELTPAPGEPPPDLTTGWVPPLP